MSRLTTLPVAQFVPGKTPVALMSDHVVTTTYDAHRDVLRCDIENGAAVILATFSLASMRAASINVDLEARLSVLGVARVNRLLLGTGAAHVEMYHRTGTLVARVPGTPLPLPCTLDGDIQHDGSWQWTGTSTVSQHGVTITQSVGAGHSAPVAPMAPRPTPTPAPAPTLTAPVAAPEPAPEPTPAPIVAPAPVAAIKVAVQKAAPSHSRGLFVYPTRNTTERIEVTPLHAKKVAAMWGRHVSGIPTTLALVGPAGTGKTSLIWDLAAEKGIGVFQVDCAGHSTTADWFGSTGLDKEGTRFNFAAFIEAIREDGEYGDEVRIVLLDELNRAESSAALNALMSILTQRTVYLPEAGITVRVSRNVFFAATMNRGSAYSGTVSLDAALVERMEGWLRLDFLSEEAETALVVKRVPGVSSEDAERLVKAARQVREVANRGEIRKSVSARMVLAAASFSLHGLSLRESAEMAWTDSYDDEGDTESERGIVLTAINAVLP